MGKQGGGVLDGEMYFETAGFRERALTHQLSARMSPVTSTARWVSLTKPSMRNLRGGNHSRSEELVAGGKTTYMQEPGQ